MKLKPVNTATSALAATALAALGLNGLSLTQVMTGGVTLGAAMVATPAWASITLPGVGVIVKKGAGNSPIVAPADNNGAVRLAGLEPGDYEVSLIGGSRPATVKVGRDGVLTTQAWASDDGKDRWVENMAGKPVRSETFDLRARFIDINTSTAAEIVRLAPTTSREAATFIVGERTKNGPFRDPINFAQRVGKSVTVDFSASPVRIGDTTIFPRGGDPKSAGFKTVAGSGVVELYGKKHNYVGHVTLLR